MFQQSTASSTVTASGNEITDATRIANTQGDARTAPDSSYGIWEATTNRVSNGGFETNTTGWSARNISAISRVTSTSKFGSGSMQATYDPSGWQQDWGAETTVSVSSSTTYTVTAWVKSDGVNVARLNVMERDSGSGVIGMQTGSGTTSKNWTRLSLTYTTASNAAYAQIIMGGINSTSFTFYVDGVQLEQKSTATPYVETNGSTASRSAGRVQLASPGNYLDANQGWVAMRVRMGSPSSAGATLNGGQNNPLFFWSDGTTSNYIWMDWQNSSTPGISMNGLGNGGTGSALTGAQTWNAGDTMTVIGYWTGSNWGISRDGANFTTGARAGTPVTSALTTFDIGSLTNTRWGDMDVLWTATGTGTLNNSDATAINAYANADPDLPKFPTTAAPTFVWKANSANYQDKLAFQIQNSSSLSLLSVDAADSSILLPNATSSSAALVLGGDANLYRSATQTLKTDGSLVLGQNLTVNGSGLFKNSTDSTTAFQIQNAAGTSNLFIADAYNSRIGIKNGTPGNTLSVGSPTTADSLGQVLISTGATTNKGLIVQGVASQTANLFEIQNSSGSPQSWFSANGSLFILTSNSGASLVVNSGNSGGQGAYFKAPASPGGTATLLQYQDNNGVKFGQVDAYGQQASYGTGQQILGLNIPAFTTSSSGTNYYYCISAYNNTGETACSSGLGMVNNTSALNWNQVNGATGYKIYRNTSNNFTAGSLLLTNINVGTTLTYTDSGSATGAGLPPVTSTGTGLTINSWGNGAWQTADLLSITTNGAQSFRVAGTGYTTAGGGLTVNNINSSSPALAVIANNAQPTTVVAYIRGQSGQTGDILQLQDPNGANLQRIDASGDQESLGYINNGIGGIGRFGNLLTYSEQFDNAAWTKTNVTAPTADTIVSPDGQTTAESLADSSSGGSVSNTSGTAPTNNTYTFSVWLKTASGTQAVDLRIDGASSGTGTAKTVTAHTTWERFFVSQNTNGFTGNIKPLIFPGGTGGSGTVHSWGAQLILATVPQVYVRTTASTVAASQGVVSNGGGFISSLNANDVPLVVQAAPSQTADLLQVQSSAGTALSVIDANGKLAVGRNTVEAGLNAEVQGDASTAALRVRRTGNGEYTEIGFNGANGAYISGSSNLLLQAAAGDVNFSASTNTTNLTPVVNIGNTSSQFGTSLTLTRRLDNSSPTDAIVIDVKRQNNSGTKVGDTALINFQQYNSSNSYVSMGQIGSVVQDATAGAEVGGLTFRTRNAGAVSETLNLAGNGAALFKNSANSSTAFQVQNASGSQLFNIDTTSSNLVTNPGFETNTTGWAPKGGATLSRVTSPVYMGNGALQSANTAAANDGAKYNLTLSSATTYTLTFRARVSTGNGFILAYGYAQDGSTENTAGLFTSGSNIVVNEWYQYAITFTTGTVSGTPYFFIKQTDATARNLFIDAVQVVQSSSSVYKDGAISLNGVVTSPVSLQNQSDSTSAFQILNAAGTNVALSVDTLSGGGSVGIGTSGALGYRLDVNGTTRVGGQGTGNLLQINSSNTNNTSAGLLIQSAGAGSSYLYYDRQSGWNGKTYIGNNANTAGNTPTSGILIDGTSGLNTNRVGIGDSLTSAAATLHVQSASAEPLFRVTDATASAVDVVNIADEGAASFRNRTNSSAAFQVQNASGTQLFNTDTVNSTVAVGNNNAPYAMNLSGATGAYGSTPDTAANSITGDIDIRVRVAPGTWGPAANQALAAKWTTSGNQRSYELLNSSGASAKISFGYSPDGTTITSGATSNVLPFTSGQAGWVRATYTAGTGAINYYYASDSATMPSSWTAAGSTTVASGSIFDSTAVVEIGSTGAGAGFNLAGNVYRAAIYNGIGGTLVNDFDPLRAATTASTTFTASTGETWTRNGTATFLANSSATFGANESNFNTNTAIFRNASDSVAAFQIQNAAGSNLVNVNTNSSLITLGSAAQGLANNVGLKIYSATSGTGSVVDLQTPVDNLSNSLYYGANAGRAQFGYDGTNSNAAVRGSSGKGFEVQTDGNSTNTFSIGTSGASIFKNYTNSTTAFQVQNAAGGTLVQVDSTNSNITLLGNNDPQLGSWSTNSNALPANRSFQSSVVANGYVYAIGGYDGTTVQPTVYYAKLNSDGSTGSWTTSSNSLPAGRETHTSVFVNGYIYVIGGYDSGFTAQSTVYYAKVNSDGSTSAWATSANPITAARAELSATTSNGYIYVIGGYNSGVQSTVYYAKVNADGTTSSWTTSANALPGNLDDESTAVANGYIYTFGGSNGSGGQTTIYYSKINSDGSNAAWTTSGNSLPDIRRYTSAVVSNGYAYVLAGYKNAGAKANNTVYYAKLNGDGSTSTWNTATNTITSGRQGPSSVIANGYIYVIGGQDSSNAYQPTIYYASTARLQVGGNLDLVGLQGQNLSNPGDPSFGSTGGSITAGNITAVGTIQVQGQANFSQNISANGNLSVGGSALFQNSANSTTALQIQNAAGTSNLLIADTTNSRIGINKAPTQGALDVSGDIYSSGNVYASNGLVLSTTSLSNGNIIKYYTAGGTNAQYDVLVTNGSSNAIVSTTARDTHVLGVANNAQTVGSTVAVVISGHTTINVDTHTLSGAGGAISVGDQLVVSPTSGAAMKDNNATSGIIGYALSSLGANTTGTVSASIRPVGGQSTPTFRNLSDSTTAFQIQNAAGTETLFAADTTARGAGGGNLIKIGNSTGTDTNTTVLVLDSATANPTSNLAALNGGLFYNSTTNKVNIIENGTVKTICNTTDLGCGTGGGGGDSITVNSAAATDANFLDVAASGTVTGSTWNLNTGPNPDDITISISNASATVAGSITTGAQTIAGDKTFNGNILAGGAATGTTATTSGTGTNTTTLTFTGTTSFANNDILFINNAGQDFYTRIVSGGNATSVTVSPAVDFDNAVTVTKYTAQNIGASASDYTTLTQRYFQGYFLGGVVTGAGSTTLSDHLLNSTGALNLQGTSVNAGSTANTTAVTLQGTAAATYVIGTSNNTGGITVGNSTDTNTISLGSSNSLASGKTQTINIGTSTGTGSTTNINIGSSIGGTTAVTGPVTITNRTSGSADTFNVSNSNSTGSIAKFLDGGSANPVFSLADGGAANFRNQTDSTTAFQVQKASGTPLFIADTTNSVIETENLIAITPGTLTNNDINAVDTISSNDGSMTLGLDGFGRYSYYDADNHDLKFAQCTNATCSTKNITSVDTGGDVGQGSSITVASADGFARISYWDATNSNLKFAQCTNADCSTHNITTVATGAATFSSIQMGLDGLPRISYNTSFLSYIQCTNAACTTRNNNTVDGSTGASFSSLAISPSDGFARISYTVASGALKYAQCTNAACTTSNLNIVTSAGDNSSIALGLDGFARISYNDSSPNYLPSYIRCTNAACSSVTSTTVDNASTYFNSVAVGSDGFARIAYSTGGGLKIAQCTNNDCTTRHNTFIDSNGGFDPSIVLGPSDYARVGYFGATGPVFAKVNSADGSGVSGSGIGSTSNAYGQAYLKGINLQGGLNIDNTGRGVSGIIVQGSNYFSGLDAIGNSVVTVSDTNLTYQGATNSSVSISTDTSQFTLGGGAGPSFWNYGSSGVGLLVGSSSSDPIFQLYNSTTAQTLLDVSATGATTFKNAVDSMSAFAIQSASYNTILNADSYNDLITVSNIQARDAPTLTTEFGGAITSNTLGYSTANGTTVAVGNDGLPNIAYWDNGLYHLDCANPDCTIGTKTAVDTSDGLMGLNTSIATGQDGYSRIAYWDFTGNDLEFAQCTNATCSTKNLTTIDSTGNVGDAPSIAIGADGFARITYYDDTNTDFKFVQCTNASCSTNVKTVIDAGVTGWVSSSVVIASDTFARISYADSNGASIHYVQCTNAACSTSTNTTVESGNTYIPSMVLGSDGFGRITYAKFISGTTYDIKFVQCTNISCSTKNTNVVDTTDSEINTALVLGSDGYARLATSSVTDTPMSISTQKFIQCTDASCSASTTSVGDLKTNYAWGVHKQQMFIDNSGFLHAIYNAYTNYGNNTSATMVSVSPSGFGAATGTVLGAKTKFASIGTSLLQTDYYLQRSGIDTATAFQIQNSLGNSQLKVDTLNSQVVIKSPTNNSSALLVENSSGDTVIAVDTATNAVNVSSFGSSILPSTASSSQSSVLLDTEIASANNTGPAYATSLTIGADGLPIISSYNSSDGNLQIAHCANKTCLSLTNNTEIPNANDVGKYSSITIGTDGLPIISYQDVTTANLRIAHCANKACTSLSSDTEISDADDVGSYSSIKIGTDGLPIISHYNSTNLNLQISKCANIACTSLSSDTEISDADQVGAFTSLAIGTDGLPIISHYNSTNFNLQISHCANAGCTSLSSDTEISNAADVGGYSSIAIGADGLPIISHWNSTNNNIQISHCANVACTSLSSDTEISDPDVVGIASSIAIGTDGLPIISHYNNTNGNLQISKCANVACTSLSSDTEISNAAIVGLDTSLAIGTDGLPVISFTNFTDNKLEVLSCGNTSCSGAGTTTTGGLDLGAAPTAFQNGFINNLNSSGNNNLTLSTNGIKRLTINAGDGAATLKSQSTTALQIQNGSSANVFNVDTTTGRADISATTSTSGQTLLSVNNSSSNSILSVRNMSTNFGSLVSGGAFEGKNAYFGEEFNVGKLNSQTCTGSTTATELGWARGDMGGHNGTTCTGGSSADLNNGELNFSSKLGSTDATCSAASQTGTVNGVERITATATATASSSANCVETLAATRTTSNKIYLAANLPVITLKIKPSTLAASNNNARIYAGLSASDTANGAGTGMPGNGIFFSNCSTYSQTAPTGCSNTTWYGFVSSGNAIVGSAQACSGTMSTSQFAYLRIEVRASNDIHFFADVDTSNGIQETECGTGVASAASSSAMSIWVQTAFATNTANSTVLDVDYLRTWQDDNVAIPNPEQIISTAPDGTNLSGEAPLIPDSPDSGQVDSSFFNFAATASEDTVFNHDVYIKGTLYADKIKANEIEGLNIFTDQINSLQSKLIAESAAKGAPTAGNAPITGQTAVPDLSNIPALTISGNLTAKGRVVFQSLTGLSLFELDSVAMTITINSGLTVNGHIVTGNRSGTTGVVAGTAITCDQTQSPLATTTNVGGNDTAGVVNATTTAGICTPGVLVSVNFATTYGSVPSIVLTPGNAATAELKYYYIATPTGFQIITTSIPAQSTTYTFSYHVLQ